MRTPPLDKIINLRSYSQSRKLISYFSFLRTQFRKVFIENSCAKPKGVLYYSAWLRTLITLRYDALPLRLLVGWIHSEGVGGITTRSILWGIGTVGSALHSHCRGQGFDSPMLHASVQKGKLFGQIFYFYRSGMYQQNGRAAASLRIFRKECKFLNAILLWTVAMLLMRVLWMEAASSDFQRQPPLL